MTVDSTSNPLDFVTTLTQAARAFQYPGQTKYQRPPAPAIVEALLQAEKAAKQQHPVYPLESLLGHWRLCFTTAQKVNLTSKRRSGFYVPRFTPAQISFINPDPTAAANPDSLQIGNQIQVGALLFRVAGQARYLGKKNLLAFEFTQMQLTLFGKTLYQGAFSTEKSTQPFAKQPISKLPFFAFFLATDDLIAARGRGGGLAMWVRDLMC